MSVIITSARSVKALVATRSLGRKGIKVVTSDYMRFAPAYYSRYSSGHFIYPSPIKKPHEFIRSLINIVKHNNFEVLMPINSEETYLIAKYKNKLLQYIHVPVHDYDTIMCVNDKSKLAKIASQLGIPFPQTYTINEISELRKVANDIHFPAVIKLKQSKSSIGLSYVHSKDKLISKFKETILKLNLSSDNYPLIQEYIPGDGYGVSALFNNSDLRAIFTHKRLREYPITGGPSTLRISVKCHKMEKLAIKLLKFLNWHGVAMVEFKLDARSNEPVLIEVNPRFWGSVNQAVSSGVDFPYLLYKMAVDGDVFRVLNYKVGVKTRFLINDFRALVSHLRKSDQRLNVLKSFLSIDKNLYYDDLSLSDPLPMLMFFFLEAEKLFTKVNFFDNFSSQYI